MRAASPSRLGLAFAAVLVIAGEGRAQSPSAGEPAPPVGDPAPPAGEPAPSGDPVAPATQPVSPATQPAAPATQPASPATQPASPATQPAAPGPASRPYEEETVWEEPLPAGPSPQELGARLGLQLSLGDLTPGGLRVGGAYQHRMTDRTWFDAEAALTFGSSQPACHLGRPEPHDLVCDHGVADGFSLQLNAGGRAYLAQRPGGLVLFGRAGAGAHLVRFGGDDVTGLAVPLVGGAGGRMAVAEGVTVGAELVVFAGPAVWNGGLGLEPYAAAAMMASVDLGL